MAWLPASTECTRTSSNRLIKPVLNSIALRDLAIEIACEVAPELRSLSGQGKSVDTKSSETDLVTEADKWSEERIVERLSDARPQDEIISEEGTRVAGTSGVRWFVDPIDGTTNFVYGHPGFSVSIAAEVDGHLTAGVIVDPILNEVFAAAHGEGATRNGQPIRVSSLTDLSRALVATGFGYRSDCRRRQAKRLVDVLPNVGDIRRMGGAALDLASVSCGRVDAFFEKGLAAWDVAAGQVLLTEAGGVGKLIRYVSSGPTDSVVVEPFGSFEDWESEAVVIAAGPGIAEAFADLLIAAHSYRT